MNFRAIILTVILPAMSVHARDKTDVMIMKNGDRMTCEVKGLERGVLYVDFDYIDGTAAVNWSNVARLESKHLFLVKTQDGSVYTGTLSTAETGAGRPTKIEVVETSEQKLVVESPEIVRMTPTSDKFWRRFNGAINLGVIYSKGNQSTQYSLGSTTEYVRERWNAHASYDSNLSSSTGAKVSTRNYLDLGARRLLPWNHWFYSGLADFLQSSEQGIGLQSTLGGGLGRYLTNTDRASVAVYGGVAWQRTNYKQANLPPSEQNVTAALLWAQAKLFKFSKTDLEATGTLLPALSDPGRLRFNTNASYYIKVISNLKWNISFFGNWDNRPPQGFSESDYGTSSGISWTFGLR
jgi:putative salt-induced outer membrane protein YdiY